MHSTRPRYPHAYSPLGQASARTSALRQKDGGALAAGPTAAIARVHIMGRRGGGHSLCAHVDIPGRADEQARVAPHRRSRVDALGDLPTVVKAHVTGERHEIARAAVVRTGGIGRLARAHVQRAHAIAEHERHRGGRRIRGARACHRRHTPRVVNVCVCVCVHACDYAYGACAQVMDGRNAIDRTDTHEWVGDERVHIGRAVVDWARRDAVRRRRASHLRPRRHRRSRRQQTPHDPCPRHQAYDIVCVCVCICMWGVNWCTHAPLWPVHGRSRRRAESCVAAVLPQAAAPCRPLRLTCTHVGCAHPLRVRWALLIRTEQRKCVRYLPHGPMRADLCPDCSIQIEHFPRAVQVCATARR
jgi:hypothetical protein